MRGMPEFKMSTQLTPKFALSLSPFDAERFSAVVKAGNNYKVYSNNIIKTTLEGVYKIAKHMAVKAEVGYVYHHKVKLIDQSPRAFWDNLFDSDNGFKYKPTFTFSVGLQYSK